MTVPSSASASRGASFPKATLIGYPRIGPNRELKKLEEALWAGKINEGEFLQKVADFRRGERARLVDLGLTEPYAIAESFSLYDQVLDAALTVGSVPARFGDVDPTALSTVFGLARGTDAQQPLELTKWFDTNYHYLVPEVSASAPFEAHPERLLALAAEAREAGNQTRPSIVGPLTLLLLAKGDAEAPDGFDPLDRLDDVVAAYSQVLAALRADGVEWVQLDEPALVADQRVSAEELRTLAARAYEALSGADDRPQILVTTPYGEARNFLGALAGIEAVHVDLYRGSVPSKAELADLGDATLVAGVVDGRGVWRANLETAAARVEALREIAGGEVSVSTSVSLQHVPYSLEPESQLPEELKAGLAFAEDKVGEVLTLASGSVTPGEVEGQKSVERTVAGARNDDVRARVGALGADDARRAENSERRRVQEERLGLPTLPTTTIGSFPQTKDVRKLRTDHRAGRIDDAQYEAGIKAEIKRVIELQEELGLDVLVHGEAERNDMVQYFAENFAGFATTVNGWVQSYGSRCTRPPILFGDVSRPEAVTVEWISYAQSLTEKPVKGMLTGPVTILAWSFVRDDQPLGDTAAQVALAIRDEIDDLDKADIGIVQVDEPALRELLPLRAEDHADYLDWSVRAFRIATSGARSETQIHTHLCYSEFETVLRAIDDLDADVTSIESARSHGEIVQQLDPESVTNSIGPGVWDIHSPRVPEEQVIVEDLRRALTVLGPERLWVNPDCGLKTRGYEETVASLKNLVSAARTVRADA